MVLLRFETEINEGRPTREREWEKYAKEREEIKSRDEQIYGVYISIHLLFLSPISDSLLSHLLKCTFLCFSGSFSSFTLLLLLPPFSLITVLLVPFIFCVFCYYIEVCIMYACRNLDSYIFRLFAIVHFLYVI